MQITSSLLTLSVAPNGSLTEIVVGNRQLLAENGQQRPLFRLRLRHVDGTYTEYSADQAKTIRLETACETCLKLSYEGFGKTALTVMVNMVAMPDSEIHFFCDIENQTDSFVEWVEFPEVTVKNELVGNGGDLRVFWPAMEGCIVEDASLRDKWPGLNYHPIEYPNKGWEGIYPGPVPMQFMACFDNQKGLYIASHDPSGMTKGIEYHLIDDGVKLEYRLFLAIEPHTVFHMDFPMVLGYITGGWEGAAEKYRRWVINKTDFLPVPLAKRQDMPEWYEDAPLVLTYPVRGEKDTGDMSPNQLFPYGNALPHIERIARETGTRIMVLLMHWEGTAPWAPPYIWPPFGGIEMFRSFVDQLHEQGNLIGLYASGIGWTDKSVLWPEYQREDFRCENHLEDIMCAAPDQSLPFSEICRELIRWGYDMCPASEKTREIVLEEIRKVTNNEVDYLQYFDQSMGGASYLCYSNHHGHQPVPGRWQAKAMNTLYEEIETGLEPTAQKPLIGCESAASECFLHHLRFNDLRYSIPFLYAKPVPAYAYVFHAYVINFMGNQNGFNRSVPFEKNPDSLLFRLGYSFVAGDVLTITLNGDGQFYWDWGTPWNFTTPDQEATCRLIRAMTSLRQGVAKPYLQYGTMQQTVKTDSADFTVIRCDDTIIHYPAVLTSCWMASGKQAQILVNHTKQPQMVKLHIVPSSLQNAEGEMPYIVEMKLLC